MPYVVRASGYIDSDGKLTKELKKAHVIEDRELADIQAKVVNGEVKEVVKITKKDQKSDHKKQPGLVARKSKETAGQSWIAKINQQKNN